MPAGVPVLDEDPMDPKRIPVSLSFDPDLSFAVPNHEEEAMKLQEQIIRWGTEQIAEMILWNDTLAPQLRRYLTPEGSWDIDVNGTEQRTHREAILRRAYEDHQARRLTNGIRARINCQWGTHTISRAGRAYGTLLSRYSHSHLD